MSPFVANSVLLVHIRGKTDAAAKAARANIKALYYLCQTDHPASSAFLLVPQTRLDSGLTLTRVQHFLRGHHSIQAHGSCPSDSPCPHIQTPDPTAHNFPSIRAIRPAGYDKSTYLVAIKLKGVKLLKNANSCFGVRLLVITDSTGEPVPKGISATHTLNGPDTLLVIYRLVFGTLLLLADLIDRLNT